MIDPADYLRAMGLPEPKRVGGQELILGEIVGALSGCPKIALPFYHDGLLAQTLHRCGHSVFCDPDESLAAEPYLDWPLHIDGLYFGTPTIVAGRALFGEPGWSVERERALVRKMTQMAIERGARCIVSGLGSGDITVAERLADMGGGAVIAHKIFRGFSDWVLVRGLEAA